MKFITYWSVRPGSMPEAVGWFLSGQGQPPKGVKMLARWHKIDCSGGWTLTETDNPDAMYENAAFWNEVVELYTHPVIEDDAAAAGLKKVYGKKSAKKSRK
jgi:hypothetical protein